MKMLLSIIAMLLTMNLWAANRIENWKNGEELRFVIRDSKGLFVSYGMLQLESWKDGNNTSEWIARKANGSFVTGFKGTLEKFAVKGLKKEQTRLVIRNKSGEFVTWKAVDSLLDAKFEAFDIDKDGKKETVYVVRYNGKFVNWAPAKLEKWSNYKLKVLVVRDSADDKNNGKILSFIAGEKNGSNVIYRDPETGRFVSSNL